VHDRKTWDQMHQIEEILGTTIVRIETDDEDKMEKTMKAALK
jgi:ATP-dependent RNA helicase DDX19/DBP5